MTDGLTPIRVSLHSESADHAPTKFDEELAKIESKLGKDNDLVRYLRGLSQEELGILDHHFSLEGMSLRSLQFGDGHEQELMTKMKSIVEGEKQKAEISPSDPHMEAISSTQRVQRKELSIILG